LHSVGSAHLKAQVLYLLLLCTTVTRVAELPGQLFLLLLLLLLPTNAQLI